MTKVANLLFITLITASCSQSYDLAYEVNSCVKELDKRYANTGRQPSSIYRVEGVEINELNKEPEIKVSTWSHNQWFYSGNKHHTYFSDSQLFSYESTDCPSNLREKYRKKDVGIDKRLKKIDI